MGGGTSGGVTPPPPPSSSWSAPDPGSAAPIGYSVGLHPTSGKAATISDLTTVGKSWNPTPGNLGPWAGPYNITSLMSYCGGAWSPANRRFYMFGGGHQSMCVPVPYSFSADDLSWRWEDVPPPTDGLVLCTQQTLTQALVESHYPTDKYSFAWGEWQGGWSGWPSGFGRPGRVYVEPAHTYNSMVVIPGAAAGNVNGALLPTSQSTGMSTGSQGQGGTHWFDLDTALWSRNASRRPGAGNQSSGIAGGACWLGGSVNRAFVVSFENGSTVSYIDVFDPSTRTWVQRTSTNSVQIPIASGGMVAHEPSGLLILLCPETSGSVFSASGVRQRMYATSAAAAAAGGHTWTVLDVAAASWPLNSAGYYSGAIAGVGWCYCPRNGCFYAIPCGAEMGTLWKLSPPAGASSTAQHLAGQWTITSESIAGGVSMRGYSGAAISGTADSASTYNRLVWDEASGCLLYIDMSIYARVQAIRPQGV